MPTTMRRRVVVQPPLPSRLSLLSSWFDGWRKIFGIDTLVDATLQTTHVRGVSLGRVDFMIGLGAPASLTTNFAGKAALIGCLDERAPFRASQQS